LDIGFIKTKEEIIDIGIEEPGNCGNTIVDCGFWILDL
jgi:hypothetical protein